MSQTWPPRSRGPSLGDCEPMTIRNEDAYRRTKIEAEKFAQAITVAQSRPPTPDVDPRIRKAQIEALESELIVLREQLDEYERRASYH
jgi:hypothetical protein